MRSKCLAAGDEAIKINITKKNIEINIWTNLSIRIIRIPPVYFSILHIQDHFMQQTEPILAKYNTKNNELLCVQNMK